MFVNSYATIPDFAAPPPAYRPTGVAEAASALARLEAVGVHVPDEAMRDPVALADAFAAAAARFKAIARNPDIRVSSKFKLVEDQSGKPIVMHEGRRIGFVVVPDAHFARWSICIEMRVDEALPAPFKWYITHFASYDDLKAFISVE